MPRLLGLRGVLTVALVVACMLTDGSANAATSAQLSMGQLRSALLSASEISAVTEAGAAHYPAHSRGVVCGVRRGVDAEYCMQDHLHSDQARVAGSPWVDSLAVLSFRSADMARRYVSDAAKEISGRVLLSTSSTRLVSLDRRTPVFDGRQTVTGTEVTEMRVADANVVLVSCADQRADTTANELVACDGAVADAQVRRLP